MAKKFLILLVACCFTSCLREDEIKLPFESLCAVSLHDGWEVREPQEVGFDPEELTMVFREFQNDKAVWQPRSLLVVKDGFLIGETYMKDPADRERPHAVWSCTKQVLAVIVMRAVETGHISSLDVTLKEVLPELIQLYPDKADISIRHLLTMTSGIDFENSGLHGNTNELLRRGPENSLQYILKLPMAAKPGEKFNYSDGDPQIISGVLSTIVGRSVGDWSRLWLFEAMGICDYDWLNYRDGLTMGAFGLMLRPRDLAKFGQLMLDRGAWQGHQIISPTSVDLITTPLVQTDYEGQQFGLLWWVDPVSGTSYMHGQGGQYVMFSREHNLVVCITSEPNTQGDSQLSPSKAFEVFHAVLGAVRD